MRLRISASNYSLVQVFTLIGARERHLIYQTIKFLFEVLESCGLANLLGLPSTSRKKKKSNPLARCGKPGRLWPR